jgi:hypothetical protein
MNEPTLAGTSRTIGHFVGSPRRDASEKSPTGLKASPCRAKSQVTTMIKRRRHERQVQGDGPGRAGGEHHRVLRRWALPSAFVTFGAVRALPARAAEDPKDVPGTGAEVPGELPGTGPRPEGSYAYPIVDHPSGAAARRRLCPPGRLSCKRSPSRCDSTTTDRSSAAVYCDCNERLPGVISPPPAMILMRSTPRVARTRTASVSPAGPPARRRATSSGPGRW